MVDYEKLDSNRLLKLGILFKTTEESEIFAAIIMEELECRVGSAVLDVVLDVVAAEEDIKSFDMCTNQEESQAWLDKYCPNHSEIVHEKQLELEQEIFQFRALIPGNILVPLKKCDDWPIEDLDLGIRSYDCLRRAGLKTVGDVLAYGDLSTIRDMGRRQVEEVKRKLWEITGMKPDWRYPPENEDSIFS